MKKIALYISAVMVFAACNNSGEAAKENTNATDTAAKTEEVKPVGKMDPVCEMEYDSTWTEYTVYKNDTIKFCSDVCKGAFAKNPDKYAANIH